MSNPIKELRRLLTQQPVRKGVVLKSTPDGVHVSTRGGLLIMPNATGTQVSVGSSVDFTEAGVVRVYPPDSSLPVFVV